MTQASKLKQTIRARARKTGESYTTARLHIVKARQKRSAPETPAPPPDHTAPAGAASPTRSGISEASVLKATGHGLGHWFAVLDAFGGATQGHTASARHLALDHGVPGWHAQGITVTYERARGLRAVNQATSGFQVSVSKTMASTVEEVMAVLRNPRRRKAWLADQDPELARALATGVDKPRRRGLYLKRDRSAGLRFPLAGTSVEFSIAPKPRGGITFVVAHTKLPNAAQVEERRAQWKSALLTLKSQLEG
jgi:hypothetical protein